MFSNILQPPSISLFSSTGSDPFQLWSLTLDTTAPSGTSVIQLLHDSAHGGSKSPYADNSSALIEPPALVELGGALAHLRTIETDSKEAEDTVTGTDRGYELDQTVLHIQSPKLPKTYIQCPPNLSPSSSLPERSSTPTPSLGLKYPWMHLQVRNLGREWSFEVGIVDTAGRTGVLRMSTFQVPNLLPFSSIPSCCAGNLRLLLREYSNPPALWT
ncbi:hypothetical protein D9756_006477 [Leucocoprinus leucothites]|uniref:CFA20 domain-containing protein n=1 Tax=Leucocoprinus leucothites TaxID=201217 RepID=A0A8H5G2G7_9AGAR|nr:hypothetical protein D9756_006477 [Leucoagaricus leucothites]